VTEDEVGRFVATLEEGIDSIDIAEREGFGYQPGARYGMRLRYGFTERAR